jgi:Type II secretion system (T2SS), protein E, N-terminal domain
VADEPGFLLVQAGLVRDDQVRAARETRGERGGTLGEHLVMAGAIDDEALTAFYVSKLVIPRVAAEDLARIPRNVLRRIPADMAAEFRVVPIASDGELNLTLAMSDPADQHIVDEVAFFTGAYVVRAAATQLQIAWCLAHYYGVLTPLARGRLMNGEKTEHAARTSAVAQALDAAEPIAPMFGSGEPWDDIPTEVEEEEETGPSRMPLVRKRREKRHTSELAPRSGTLDGGLGPPPEPERLPAVVVDDEELTGQRDYAALSRKGAAALDDGDLPADDERTPVRRTTEPLDADPYDSAGNGVASRIASGSGEILLDVPPQGARSRSSPQTEPGLGRFGAVDSRPQASHDTGASRGDPWVENEGENDTVRRQSKADRRGRKSQSEATPGANEPSPDVTDPTDDSSEPTTDPGEPTTNPMRRMPLSAGTGTGGPSGARGGEWNVDEGWDLPGDDGWGPPGSTIPPDYLGARPDSDADQDLEPTPVAPLPTKAAREAHGITPYDPVSRSAADLAAPVDGAGGSNHSAVSAAAASAAAAAALAGAQASPAVPTLVGVVDESALDPAELAAELDRSSNRLLETLRALERAPGRDEIVDILLDHMGASMRRRAFFAVKGGALFAFRQYGAARPGVGTAELSLDQPSTFAQVALNRVVYRGTLSPAAVEFVENALGSAAKGDAVVVPIEVRGRPVGLLYGDGLTSVVFEEHQTVLGRAAGQALERILSQRAARESGGPS